MDEIIFLLFKDSLTANLLRLIQKMKPKPAPKEKEKIVASELSDLELKKKLFPGLSLPNDSRGSKEVGCCEVKAVFFLS